MYKPQLVVMAAGMGSRFGGSKQVTPVDDEGQVIMDYSIFDAVRAGFSKVICVIKKDFEASFRRDIGDRIARSVELEYAYQSLDMLPKGYSVPEGRVKPWGTAHAAMCGAEKVDQPFCVINADDFYGADAFEAAYDFLSRERGANEHAMVGYQIENTLTEHGSVSRGICETDGDGNLTGLTERTRIEPREGGAAFTEDDGGTYTFVPSGTYVSMNMWCFGLSMKHELKARFAGFLDENLPVNPLKCEYYLPLVPSLCVREGTASVRVLRTDEKWYGVTYRDDLESFKRAIADMKLAGKYPEKLWRQSK